MAVAPRLPELLARQKKLLAWGVCAWFSSLPWMDKRSSFHYLGQLSIGARCLFPRLSDSSKLDKRRMTGLAVCWWLTLNMTMFPRAGK